MTVSTKYHLTCSFIPYMSHGMEVMSGGHALRAEDNRVGQWFSKCGPLNQQQQHHLTTCYKCKSVPQTRSSRLETQGWDPGGCVWNKSFRWFWCTPVRKQPLQGQEHKLWGISPSLNTSSANNYKFCFGREFASAFCFLNGDITFLWLLWFLVCETLQHPSDTYPVRDK